MGPIVGGALVYGVGFRWMTGVRLHIRPVIVAYHFLIGRAGRMYCITGNIRGKNLNELEPIFAEKLPPIAHWCHQKTSHP